MISLTLLKKVMVLVFLVPAFFADVAPGGCCGSTTKPVDREQYEQTEDKKAEEGPQNTTSLFRVW